MQQQEIVIWGSGRFAELAYYYYRENCNILYFVDSNPNRWNKEYCGKMIECPNKLKSYNGRVVMAFQAGKEAVRQKLNQEYGIEDVSDFSVVENNNLSNRNIEFTVDNSIVVAFSGGLGNQLFQFAFLYSFLAKGKKSIVDISYYSNSGVMDFELSKAFDLSSIDIVDTSGIWREKLINIALSNETKKFMIYKEPTIYEQPDKIADTSLLNVTGGLFSGTFQTYFYLKQNEEDLIHFLKFNSVPDDVNKWIKDIKGNSLLVSVHIRRGDYLTEKNELIYGNICTKKYYQKAIDYMRRKYGNVRFLFFSDDIEYVKNEYCDKDYYFSDLSAIDGFQDWYELYAMAQCDHNIIANSTFSWWGAMFNRKRGKTVIAPSKWVNMCNYRDIYPENWITFEG